MEENLSKAYVKGMERLECLFTFNTEWENDNPFTPGDQNPYPDKIYNAFLKFYNKYYTAIVSYQSKYDGDVVFEADEDTLYDATDRAVFSCETFRDCVGLLESWVQDYYEDRLDDELMSEVHVETVTKDGEKFWEEPEEEPEEKMETTETVTKVTYIAEGNTDHCLGYTIELGEDEEEKVAAIKKDGYFYFHIPEMYGDKDARREPAFDIKCKLTKITKVTTTITTEIKKEII